MHYIYRPNSEKSQQFNNEKNNIQWEYNMSNNNKMYKVHYEYGYLQYE